LKLNSTAKICLHLSFRYTKSGHEQFGVSPRITLYSPLLDCDFTV
jgi:hypothetical protein